MLISLILSVLMLLASFGSVWPSKLETRKSTAPHAPSRGKFRFRVSSFYTQRHKWTPKTSQACHSEHSEESVFLALPTGWNGRGILRYAQNDIPTVGLLPFEKLTIADCRLPIEKEDGQFLPLGLSIDNRQS